MPNDVLTRVAKYYYLDYRRARALKAGRKSPKMIAAINAVDSKLAVRGRMIPFGTSSEDIVEVAKFMKFVQRTGNQKLATEKLGTFLDGSALPLKDELDLLANYIVSKSPPGVKWIAGPLKKIEKAMSKTEKDYDFAWGLNKDLVRGTLVCETNVDLELVAAKIKETCTHQYGMFLIKQDNQKSVRDGGEMGSGYSGWNFVVQFKEHNLFGAEVQANTAALMYGKMSKHDFCEQLRHSESQYAKLQYKLKFPGGLGHALYDIQDEARSGASKVEGNLARELCLDYNDACRGQFRKTTLMAMNKRIQEFAASLTSAEAKKLWKHAIEECAWTAFQIARPI